MAVKIQLRRGNASDWSTANPILDAGEPGFEVDTGKMKIGNGTDHWNDLPYATGGTDEKVKSDASDGTAGYLSDKVDGDSISVDTTNHVLKVNVDNSTIEIDTSNHYIKVKDNIYTPYSHLSDTSNPHSVTKDQVGLSNVTNDSQLKRSADDIHSSFGLKNSLSNDDIFIIEDSDDSYNKKSLQYSTIQDNIDQAYEDSIRLSLLGR